MSREIPCPRILREQWEHRRSDHWVFANKYGNQISHPLDKLKAICRRAGIAEATLHGLRHSFGSHLRMAGTSLADIADLMGHKDLATTQIYAKVEQTHLRSIVSRLSPLVLDQVAPKSGPQSILEENRKNNLLLISGLGEGTEGLAGRQGFEPRSDGPEPPVLPLDDLPTGPVHYSMETTCGIQAPAVRKHCNKARDRPGFAQFVAKVFGRLSRSLPRRRAGRQFC